MKKIETAMTTIAGRPTDEIYLNSATKPDIPMTRGELRGIVENKGVLILTNQAETFCRQVVLFGALPTLAYEYAFATEGPNGEVVKPDDATLHAKELLTVPEIGQRIKELRDEVINYGGQVMREEVLGSLKRTMLDPTTKKTDSISAAKVINQMEGFEKQPDILAGKTIVINMPFTPQPLGRRPEVIEGEVVKESDPKELDKSDWQF